MLQDRVSRLWRGYEGCEEERGDPWRKLHGGSKMCGLYTKLFLTSMLLTFVVHTQDKARANDLLAQSTGQGFFANSALPESVSSPTSMAIDEMPPVHSHSNTPTYGTPIRLAPSASAFRKVAPSPMQGQVKAVVPQGNPTPAPGLSNGVPPASASPGKGMLGQVSDLIFGW